MTGITAEILTKYFARQWRPATTHNELSTAGKVCYLRLPCYGYVMVLVCV